jgi:C-terminal processing protease CtpA/Prc
MKNFGRNLILALATSSLLFLGPHGVMAQGPRDDEPDSTIDAATRTAVIDGSLKRLNDSYVFPEVAKKMEQAIRDRMAKKEYDQITSAKAFAKALTMHLQEVSHDKHLRVDYSHETIPVRENRQEPTAEERERFRLNNMWGNFGFEKIERLEGNIGYLSLRGFTDTAGAEETVAAAMNFLGNTDALIIDLRRNGGGMPEMVALISSYLFGEKPVHLNSLYWREGNRTEDFWTKDKVLGKRFADKDVYVLTSNRTFSAAEEFTYNLKNLKRATIVGEVTGGGANPGGGFRITDHFGMFVPTGKAINPITKTNWEGTGVKPDVEVPADQALKTAHLDALKKVAVKQSDNPRRAGDFKRLIERTQKELDELRKNQKPSA